MSGEALPGVSHTAVWVAGMRAVENARDDRLFDDRFAGLFVSASGGQVAQAPFGASEFLAIRTRFFDDQALAARRDGLRQVVLLAAGLDCRAFRLDWPEGVRLFELDLPEIFAFKQRVLASVEAEARCARLVVAVDLRGEWAEALTAVGFDPGVATVWLAEGLLPYLPPVDSGRLLSAVTGLSAPGSRLVFDHIEAAGAEQPGVQETADTIRKMGAELQPTMDSPMDWLTAHGWRAEVSRVPALGEGYGRPLPDGVDMASSNAIALISANR